ncbi:MAG: undecaprenyl-phosphate glucose phosphotransferase [Gammaproteobacteria bacterium]
MISNGLPNASLWKRLLNPLVIVSVLTLVTLLSGVKFDGYYLVLAIIVFFVSSQLFQKITLMRSLRKVHVLAHIQDILIAWGLVVGVVLLLGYVTELYEEYSNRVLMAWFISTPAILFLSHILARTLRSKIIKLTNSQRRVVIAGINELGHQLAQRIKDEPHLGIEVMGFFDDRNATRLNGCSCSGPKLEGGMSDLADYVRQHKIDIIYIALPMSSRPQIMQLLHDLYDTTASTYFVLDIFIFDLIQPRMDAINGIPIVAITESPFLGVSGVVKKVSDIVMASIILLLLSPLMLLIALGVKLTSPGKVLFKQRRYGLNGEEIRVYKFRSMTVCEDGQTVIQAKKGDQRITPFGAFLRKTSLDELPQFFNVLLGDMSIVGPRPHAVAHNELYRKYIKGYMLRHKVRPGITGWAQVHGLRGETETMDKMKARIDYDLDYLRNWSLSLDLWIIIRTAFVIFKQPNAY